MKKLRAVWQSSWSDVERRVRVGRILGLVFITAGFIVIGKAWDGASSKNQLPAQIPYLLSGGFMGTGLVITGCTLLLLSSVRGERQVLTDRFDEMVLLLGRNLNRLQVSANGAGDAQEQVVAGKNAYHRTGCKILSGKKNLTTLSAAQAAAEGLNRCRVCDPPAPPEQPDRKDATDVIPEASGTPSR